MTWLRSTSGMTAFSFEVYSCMMRAGPSWLWSHAMLHRVWADVIGANRSVGRARRLLRAGSISRTRRWWGLASGQLPRPGSRYSPEVCDGPAKLPFLLSDTLRSRVNGDSIDSRTDVAGLRSCAVTSARMARSTTRASGDDGGPRKRDCDGSGDDDSSSIRCILSPRLMRAPVGVATLAAGVPAPALAGWPISATALTPPVEPCAGGGVGGSSTEGSVA